MALIGDLAVVRSGLALAGRGAGRRGNWTLRLVESRDVQDDRLELANLGKIDIVRESRTERHLLQPFDVLVTARAGSTQSALVPPDVSRTVAAVTILVVRPRKPELGLGHYLWYFLTSAHGRAQLARRLTMTATITSLSARSIREFDIPVPSHRELDALARLVEASEAAYTSTTEAARLRREALRDSIIHDIGHTAAPARKED